jgi:V8-like Glu-specific endopeptidase
MSPRTRIASIAVFTAMVTIGFGQSALAQEALPAPLITEPMPVKVDSGDVPNEGDAEMVVFSQNIFIPGAAALRLEFTDVQLAGLISDGSGSYLRIRSLFDGAEQRLNAMHVRQWGNTSAYFNGDEVTIEIVAQPGTGNNFLRMDTVRAQFEPFVEESICGPTDDRELSYDNRAARLLPVGCTGWLINDCSHCFLTAGHCSTSSGSFTAVQFNVPLSNNNGSLNHPPPEDQYAPDTASRQSNNGGGIGNDYAYFGVFPNSNTGLTPFEAYGDSYQITVPPPVQGQDIRITGYGVTGNPVPPSWNQVQKTHAGPYFNFSGSTVSYTTDTTGGNSGSPVIDDSTGMAIGIHTHGGCNSSGGNFGTGLNHSGFQGFLANPRGVCECTLLNFYYPDGLPENLDPSGGDQIVLEVLANGDSIPQPGTGLFYYDAGAGFVSMAMNETQDNVYVATFPAVDCGVTVRYYFSAETTLGEVANDPRFAPGDAYEALAALSYTEVANDNFESDTGWRVFNFDLAEGAWERANPNIMGGSAPENDADGSGKCYLTGNYLINSDVDGGPTRLVSPDYDISGLGNPMVNFSRWFSNVQQDEDRMVIEVSGDAGGSWVTVSEVAHSGRQWVEDGFAVRDYLPTSSQVRVRFSVSDNPNNSDTEAGLDAFILSDVECGGCPADFNGDGTVNTQDVLAFLNAWAAGDDTADFNGDGDVNTLDVLAFLNAWSVGC